jgi:DNA repair protein RAD5
MISSLLHTSCGGLEPVETPDVQPDAEELSAPARPRQLRLNAAFQPIPDPITRTTVPTTTLIIAPTSLMTQWATELERSSRKGSLTLLVWHGNNRNDLDGIVNGSGAADVVITSYGVVGSEWTKHENSSRHGSPLFQGDSA